ncbi:MAG: sensor domain-containing diguanylate cyclase [Nostocaceae cyanobacterium]|nr:sensor domain-containing diguanylate cyclase [Nostocaceae cyanobacterium]
METVSRSLAALGLQEGMNPRVIFQIIKILQHLLHQQTSELRKLNQQLRKEISLRKLLEEKLRTSETQMRAVVEAMTDIILVINIDDKDISSIEILPTNPNAWYETDTDLIGQTVDKFFHEQTADSWFRKVKQVLDIKQRINFDYSLFVAGQQISFTASISPFSDNSVIWVARDISERVLMEEALRESEERYRAVVDQSAEGIYFLDVETRQFIEANATYLNLVGYTNSELLELSIDEISSTSMEILDARFEYVLREKHLYIQEAQQQCKDGTIIDISASISLIIYRGRKVFCVVVKDITERKKTEKALRESEAREREKAQALELALKQLQRLANLDGLTQIANRYCFNEYLNNQWYFLASQQSPIALILLDIDYFKPYNDTYGHPTGDACLVQIANTISSAVKPEIDLVARYGGEEFAVILPNADTGRAVQVAQAICDEVKRLKITHAASLVADIVTVSLGIAITIPSLNISYEVLIEKADQALYKAKNNGRNCYQMLLC